MPELFCVFLLLLTLSCGMQADVIAELASSDADMNAVEGHGYTPVGLAASTGSVTLVRTLVTAGALPDAGTVLPLHAAAARGDLVMMRALLTMGAHIDSRVRAWMSGRAHVEANVRG